MLINNWTKGLWISGPPCSAPPQTLTRMTNMQVMDEGVVQTRPGSTLVTNLANTVDGVYIAGMHFYKDSIYEVYRDTTDLGFSQQGTVSNPNYLRVAAMTAFGVLDDIVFFPVSMKKYWSPTGVVSNWGISEIPGAPNLASGGVGNLSGEYTYKLAFYNSSTKTLGTLSLASTSLSVSGAQIIVSNLPVTCADAQVDKVNIYRTFGGITGTWYYVDSVNLGTLTYTDNLGDAGLLDSVDLFYISPLPDLVANAAARYGSRMLLFAIQGNPRFCYASLGSKPEGFLSNVYEQVADAGDTIETAAMIGSYLYVFGQQAVYNFQINPSNIILVSKLPTAVGTVNGRTVSMGGQGLYYCGPDGVYLFQGFTPVLVSDQIDALFRGIDRGGLSTIADWGQLAGTFVGGRYYLSYYGADSQWHTVVFNERKNRWKHYTGWKYTVSPGLGAYPYAGLASCVAQTGVQGVYTDNGESYWSECGFNVQAPMTELNEIREFRLSAECSGELSVSFYDGVELKYAVSINALTYDMSYRRYSLPNGTYFSAPEVRVSSYSPFTLRMFEAGLVPVRQAETDYTRPQK